MKSLSNAQMRILRAREKVARRNVFFASILYTARLIETDIAPFGLKTMFTNGIDIYFHPEFVADNDAYIEGVVLHETLHCAFCHVHRKGDRDARLWNIACDYAINPLIQSIFPLPKCALIDRKYEGLSAEKIYELLKENQPDGPDGESEEGAGDEEGQKGKGGTGPEQQSGPMQEPTPDELEKAEREWRRVVKLASDKAEKAGTMHGALKTLVEDLFPSDKLDWRKALEDMARDAKSDDAGDWSRPNRRFIGEGQYFPGRINDKHFRLVACLDVSGSVSDAYKKEMKSELMNLLDQKIVTSVVMISTDTQITNKEEVFDSEGVANFDFKDHGGGTDFQACMKEVAKVEDAVGCVFLTDMATCSFGDDPGIPTVWVDWTGNGTQSVPYGRVTTLGESRAN